MDGTGFKKRGMDRKEKFAGAGLRGGHSIEGDPQMSHLMLTGTHQRRIIFYSGNLRACLYATLQWGSHAAIEPDSGM